MSRDVELHEERALAAWKEDQALLPAALRYILDRASRCMRCTKIALWRFVDRRPSGNREDLLCDEHRVEGSVELHGANLLRRIQARKR